MITWLVVLLFVVIAAVGGGVFFVMSRKSSPGEVLINLQSDNIPRPSEKKVQPQETQPKRKQMSIDQLNVKSLENSKEILDTDMCFVCTEGANKGEVFLLSKYVTTIGRRSTDGRVNDMEFSSVEKKISRSQGMVVYHSESGVFYYVNEATSPVFVNGEQVESAYPLEEGDFIELGGGNVLLAFQSQKR